MRETVPIWLERGVTWTVPYVTLLAETLIQEDCVPEALDIITKGMEIAREPVVVDVVTYPGDCVMPPDGVKSVAWLEGGMQGAKCN